MTAYYNEIDPYAAQWLRNLIAAGRIAPGEVDERSILDVSPADLTGFTQCHFFAGVGVWSYALRLANWSDCRPVWTGSCPCQPFSVAGLGGGLGDERHLWPFWFHLIEQCSPSVVFGEQVEAAIKHGWLDLVQSDMEGIGYAFAAAGIPAAGVGAPHIRQRVYFVADADIQHGRERLNVNVQRGQTAAPEQAGVGGCDSNTNPTNRFWRNADWLLCRDGKYRPVEPGTFPLAHGVAARVGRLRAYGNAICPQAAHEMIAAYLECQP
jgi:DNA (cytosine-5)-methyltransferase 1